jgi:hypothetical protein
MHSFLQQFGSAILGVLSGFDRLLFRGTLRNLASPDGLRYYLRANEVKHVDFKAHSLQVTEQLTTASLAHARALGREIRYLNSSQVSKEDIAQQIAARDGIRDGLICVLRSIDPCLSFTIRGNRATQRREIYYQQSKCLHLYHYQIHPVFGFMHARIQTWLPFRVYVCLNGRAWLARQMDQAGLAYQRRDNCFTQLEDVARAQALFDEQLHAHWPSLLDDIARSLNPAHETLFARFPTRYYWSVAQSEWATDVMFRTRADLEALYPRLWRHALTTYGAVDVLRFLGRKIPAAGVVPPLFNGAVLSNVKDREEGVRVKYWLNNNSLKLYDKGPVLRSEATINDPKDFRVYRPKEGEPEGELAWRPLRLGVADLHRRGQVSQAANERHLEALAAVTDATPLRQWAEPLCRPVSQPCRGAGGTGRARRVRALNPLAAGDAALLEAVSRPEFLQNGLRNRDLRRLLYPEAAGDAAAARRQSAAVSRKLALLRAHGLIQKVPKTHRYLVSATGRKAITALLAARNASAEQLTGSAA